MRLLFAAALALPMFSGRAFGWGCDGHQIVALIARGHLTAAANAAVDRLFAEAPLAPAHRNFCQDQPTDLMADAAPWADDIKTADKTFLWHQIDIPLAVDRGDYRSWCPPIGPSVNGKDRPGCVVNAIAFERSVMTDARQPPAERAKALRMLIHLMGDLSQPLHVSDNRDEGGNCTSVKAPFPDAPANLHGIWDYALITREMQQGKLTEMQLAANIDRDFAARGRSWVAEKADIERWTWEAHAIAKSTVYGLLTPRIATEPAQEGFTTRAACDAERGKTASLRITLDQAYLDKAQATIHEQLAKAGYRLAAVLNQDFR